jgi:hypothetical protein
LPTYEKSFVFAAPTLIVAVPILKDAIYCYFILPTGAAYSTVASKFEKTQEKTKITKQVNYGGI